MIETVFGSGSPLWTALPGAGFAVQAPLGVGGGAMPRSGFMTPTVVAGPAGQQSISGSPALPANAYGYPSFAAGLAGFAGPNALLPFGSTAATLIAPEAMGWTTPAALLAAVALRRGQPQGPTNDHEAEEFVYDTLELLAGASDVEVRVESGRATLTGTVQHKRLKHDIGEIAWAIPGLQDVQNNITITSRRRMRAAAVREAEAAPSGASRKQA